MSASHRISLRHVLLAATFLSSPLILGAPTPAAAQLSVSITVPTAPPVLPVYDQPPLPDVGYVWTPGYWAWDSADGYYWVPGTWVEPPQANVLWTPPYWGWSNNVYVFYAGYWGPQVGYYGGVNYGYGYGGRGYQGGRWEGGHFAYNRAANNFGSVQVPNAYETKVTNVTTTHVSYEGGPGGLRVQPTAQERQAQQAHHMAMTSAQTSLIAEAAKRPDLAAKNNGGHPAIVATSRPGQFEGAGVVRGEPSKANANAGAPAANPNQPGQAEHAGAAPAEHGAAPSAVHATGPAGQHEAARPEQNGTAAAAGHPGPATAEHGTPVEHATTEPAQHEAAHPEEHAATPPAAHEAARPTEHATAPAPVEHEAARPAEHATAPAPVEHEVARPAEHAAVPPAVHEAPRPAEHAAAPPPRPAAPPAQHAMAQPAPHPAPAAHPAPEEKKEK